MSLKGKVAIVTGGTRGIGEAIVKRFAKGGCRVAFTYNKNKKLAFKIARETKGKAKGYRVDVRNFKKIKKFISDVKSEFKRIDILINNAGIVRDKSLMMMEEKDWNEVIDTNLKGAFNTTKACIVTFMKQRSGNIVNISSLAGVVGIAGQTNYSASKAGLLGFTKSLAKEVGPYNVRVNAIAPGFIQTDMTASLQNKEKILKKIPLGRFGTANEIAEVAYFLVSNEPSYITAQTLIIDGGLL